MSILPSFLNTESQKERISRDVISVPREYGMDFQTGELTGEIVEGIEAIKVWIWLCIHIERYRFPIYSWQYGSEIEQYIGQTVTEEFLYSEYRNAVEDALKINPWIEGIHDFSVSIQKEKLYIKFTVVTTFGETRMEMYV